MSATQVSPVEASCVLEHEAYHLMYLRNDEPALVPSCGREPPVHRRHDQAMSDGIDLSLTGMPATLPGESKDVDVDRSPVVPEYQPSPMQTSSSPLSDRLMCEEFVGYGSESCPSRLCHSEGQCMGNASLLTTSSDFQSHHPDTGSSEPTANRGASAPRATSASFSEPFTDENGNGLLLWHTHNVDETVALMVHVLDDEEWVNEGMEYASKAFEIMLQANPNMRKIERYAKALEACMQAFIFFGVPCEPEYVQEMGAVLLHELTNPS